MGSRDDYAARLLKYMADMGMPEAMTDQEQNQTLRLVAQFAERERKHIRRAIAPALKELHDQSDAMACVCKFEGMVERKPPCATCRNVAALDAIDAATRAPKRRPRNAR